MAAPSGVMAPSLTVEDVPAAVEAANVPTLLALLVQLTGSSAWMDERYRPERARGIAESDGGGLGPELQAEVREAATEAIIGWLQGQPVAIERFDPDEALRLLSFTVAEDVPAEYAGYLLSVLDQSAPQSGLSAEPESSDPLAERSSLQGLAVAVIGAGISGVAAAISLLKRGASVVLFERTDAIGGTWNLNRYPGCGVDTASHLYSFSSAPGDWEHYYAPQPQLQAYVDEVAREAGVYERIEFNTDVKAARWDGARSIWTLDISRAGQPLEQIRADVVISAVGAFGRKSMPAIPGLDSFAGPVYHSAEWPTEVELDGRRVAVVGTGASAMQLVPAIADSVGSMTIFQRTAQWAAPFEQLHQPIPMAVRSLLRTVPLYLAWYRARLGWMLNDKIHESLQMDPDWPRADESINAINAGHRRFFTRYITGEIGDDPELLAKVIPSYPPFGKRMLLDNGWFRTLRRDNVELVTERIEAVEPEGVRLSDQRLVEADVLVLATGFDVVHYLAGVDVEGIDGRTLVDAWDTDNGKAYLGLTVPGFPNFFCLYGPNAAPGHGGSYIATVECQLDYLADLLEKMRATGSSSVDCRQDVFDAYNDRVDAANGQMIWSHPGCSTYYRNSRGRVVYTNPWRIVDFWAMTRMAELADYTLRRGPETRAGERPPLQGP